MKISQGTFEEISFLTKALEAYQIQDGKAIKLKNSIYESLDDFTEKNHFKNGRLNLNNRQLT